MESTQPKPFVFVLMPFAPTFDDVYQLGIKPACEDAGGYCERVDEQIFESSILERVYNQINKADLIVADMTGKNANVFYEVGYAHALGKRVILLTQDSGDIPFDLKHYPHIVYERSITEMKGQLRERVAWHLRNLSDTRSDFESHQLLEYFINRKLIQDGAVIAAESLYDASERVGHPAGIEFDLTFGMRNPTNRILSSSVRHALVFPDTIEFSSWPSNFQRVALTDGRNMALIGPGNREYLPKIEESLGFRLRLLRDGADDSQVDVPFELRFYTPFGVEKTDSSIQLEIRD